MYLHNIILMGLIRRLRIDLVLHEPPRQTVKNGGYWFFSTNEVFYDQVISVEIPKWRRKKRSQISNTTKNEKSRNSFSYK